METSLVTKILDKWLLRHPFFLSMIVYPTMGSSSKNISSSLTSKYTDRCHGNHVSVALCGVTQASYIREPKLKDEETSFAYKREIPETRRPKMNALHRTDKTKVAYCTSSTGKLPHTLKTRLMDVHTAYDNAASLRSLCGPRCRSLSERATLKVLCFTELSILTCM